ncbi:MAG: hypothetical protein EAZ47_02780 [Bacteroidetes bacterium]|nr:MAG: hypothetical protein EAZ47_02780 [Bacteroidota bacterium]
MKSKLLCMLGFLCCDAQNHIIDSLEKLTQVQRNSELAGTYNELTWKYRGIDAKKALEYGNKAIQLGNKIGYLPAVAQAYNDIGIIFFDKEMYDSAIQLYNKSLQIRQKLNDNLGVAKCYNKIGIIYQRKAEFEKALDAQYKALQGFEEASYDFGTSNAVNNIAILHQNLGRFEQSIKYHNQALAIRKKINDRVGIVQSYNNIANVQLLQENFEDAKIYYYKAIEVAKAINYSEGLSAAYNNLGSIYSKQDSLNLAVKFNKQSLLIRQKMNDTKGIVSNNVNLSEIYIKQKNFDSALVLLKNTEEITKKNEIYKLELPNLYKSISTVYEELSKQTEALVYYKKYSGLKDTLFSEGIEKKFAEQETKYNTLKKEQLIQRQQNILNKNLLQIANQNFLLASSNLQLAEDSILLFSQNQTILQNQLDSSIKEEKITNLTKAGLQKELALQKQQAAIQQKNTTIIIVAGIGALLLLFGYGVFRKKQLEQKAVFAAEQAKQREQLTQAVIQAEEAERKRIASDLHDGVGQLFSAVKMNLSGLLERVSMPREEDQFLAEKTMALVDESCKEVRVISHKMMPNFLLKSGIASDIRSFIEKIDEHTLKINFESIGFKEQLEFNEEVILYRVIQELINNVIKHSQANQLDLMLEKNKQHIQVSVADNGKGFDYETAVAKGGLGLKNILVRVEYLKGSIEFLPNKPTGSLVKIMVPIA